MSEEDKIPYLVENKERDTFTIYVKGTKPYLDLQQENKQLKEELENDIDRYEDTISYQLGFDKGKEYLQQIIDNAKEYIKNILKWVRLQKDWETEKILLNLLILLGDKENE